MWTRIEMTWRVSLLSGFSLSSVDLSSKTIASTPPPPPGGRGVLVQDGRSRQKPTKHGDSPHPTRPHSHPDPCRRRRAVISSSYSRRRVAPQWRRPTATMMAQRMRGEDRARPGQVAFRIVVVAITMTVGLLPPPCGTSSSTTAYSCRCRYRRRRHSPQRRKRRHNRRYACTSKGPG